MYATQVLRTTGNAAAVASIELLVADLLKELADRDQPTRD
jgi:hypothetical protein